MEHKIKFCGANRADNRILADGWQTWGKRRNVLRVIYDDKRHPTAKYFLMEKIGRRWYEYGHYHSLEEAISPYTMAYKRQLTNKSIGKAATAGQQETK